MEAASLQGLLVCCVLGAFLAVTVQGAKLQRPVHSSDDRISLSLRNKRSADGFYDVVRSAFRGALDPPEYVFAKAQIFPNPALRRGDRLVQGVVNIRQRKSTMGTYTTTEYKISLEGLAPSSLHGFHVHEFGTIGASCSHTGGHYNPFEQVHGSASVAQRHVGDLGNIQADEEGKVEVTYRDTKAKLYTLTTVVGRGIVVHADMDDFGLNPDKGSKTTGNAGARLACGTVLWSNGDDWGREQP